MENKNPSSLKSLFAFQALNGFLQLPGILGSNSLEFRIGDQVNLLAAKFAGFLILEA